MGKYDWRKKCRERGAIVLKVRWDLIGLKEPDYVLNITI